SRRRGLLCDTPATATDRCRGPSLADESAGLCKFRHAFRRCAHCAETSPTPSHGSFRRQHVNGRVAFKFSGTGGRNRPDCRPKSEFPNHDSSRIKRMKFKVAVQMDPIARINIRGDSTFALLLEAQKRGHDISYYTPEMLSLRGQEVVATVQPLTVRDQDG